MSTGIDVVGWRSCSKQTELGPKRFVAMLKKIGRMAAEGRGLVAPSMPPVAVTPDQRRRLQVHQELRQAVVQFDQGTPECKACPISDGRSFGCYTAIDFPIDVDAETALFRYFSAQLEEDRSTGEALYKDLVSKVPAQGTAWHTERGLAGALAELETPLVKEWGFLLWKKRVDSAQLLASLFFNQRRIGLISALAQFWNGFIAEARNTAPAFDGSKTLLQLEELNSLYDRVMELASATDGIHLLVESDAPPVAGAKD